MDRTGPTIAYITAGAGGMYCGSCLSDNALAVALTRMGVDIQLIPTYTPIRTDETDVSIPNVFLGGINVYLQQKMALFRYLPAFLDGVLNHPRLIRWATARHVQIEARQLGELTMSMLRGAAGFQRKEVRRLCHWLMNDVRPQLVQFTNILIAGCAPELKSKLQVPLLVTLQGDDVFLEQLPKPYRLGALEEIRRLIPLIDGFVVHSDYYADYMSEYLGIPRERIHQVKLGIATADYESSGDGGQTAPATGEAMRSPTIGYLARLAPEKGLHVLCDAFVRLRQRPEMSSVRLRIAGWLGEQHRTYAEASFQKLADAGCADAMQYDGDVNRHEKIEFLRQIDVLSVPTVYRDPKGLYVLEAMAAGVPVVQPEHGAFPEIIKATGGGRLVRPNDPQQLADTISELLMDSALRRELGQRGRRSVHENFNSDAMARATLNVYRQFLPTADAERGPSRIAGEL